MEIHQTVRARAIKDPQFRAQLLAEPASALGVDTAAQIRVLEDSDELIHLVIPTQPLAYDDAADATRRVAARAQADAEFCSELMENPHEVLSAALGAPLPKSVRIVVCKDTDSLVHVVCPAHGPVGVAQAQHSAAAGTTASWGCEVTTADSPCTLEGNSFCTATRGCKTVHGGDPDCSISPDDGPTAPSPTLP